jgi:SOS response regulatory protein OraA/RecX
MATKRTVKQPLDCHERALRLLASRPRARREVESRLRRAGFDAAEVTSELDRLEDVGLLDDGAFARELADHLTGRGSARRAVAGALASKGVSRQTIEQTLAGLEGDESLRALEVATERARRLTSLRPGLVPRPARLRRRRLPGGRQGGPGDRRPPRLSDSVGRREAAPLPLPSARRRLCSYEVHLLVNVQPCLKA